MPQITLHLGAHRTASTHLQGVLAKNTALLAASGLASPTQAATKKALTSRLNPEPSLPSGAFAQLLKAANIAPDARLILSDENFIGFLNEIFSHQKFYPNSRARLQRLRRMLPGAPEKVLFSIRSYSSFFASAYGRWLSPVRPVVPRDLCAELVLGLKRGWDDLAADIAAVFPESELLIVEYSPSPAFGSDQLFRLLGPLAKQLEYNPNYRWNRSMSARQTRLYEQAVQAGEGADEVRALIRLKQPPLTEGFWDEATQAALEARYEKDRAAIIRQFPAFVMASPA